MSFLRDTSKPKQETVSISGTFETLNISGLNSNADVLFRGSAKTLVINDAENVEVRKIK